MEKLKYALYTGCTARESTPELLKSTLAIADKLGIELILLDEASCCGASHLQDYDDFLSRPQCPQYLLCREIGSHDGDDLQYLPAQYGDDKTPS